MSVNIIIKKIRSPSPGSLIEDIDYICKSFGYFSSRDKNDTAGKIFRLLVNETCNNEKSLSSDEIADKLNLTRGAIIYHLNNFISAGLVIKEHNKYRLRSQSIQKIIEEIRADIDRIMGQMLKIATDIDDKLGNFYR